MEQIFLSERLFHLDLGLPKLILSLHREHLIWQIFCFFIIVVKIFQLSIDFILNLRDMRVLFDVDRQTRNE